MPNTVVVLGATGDLGGRMVKALLAQQANVRALVRPESDRRKVGALRRRGVEIIEVAGHNIDGLREGMKGASCVLSALSGTREIIIDAQLRFAEAAAKVGVKRFIPSDYSIDFSRLSAGSNRNLDWRREFWSRLEAVRIRPTTVFNGAFVDMLVGPMPLLVFPLRRVVYWGDPDQRMDFTSRDDVARFTASAALDPRAPRVLRIAGDQISPYELAELASEVYGHEFTLFRAGGLGALRTMIKVTRAVSPGKHDVYPPWQGMQYMHNMLGGRAKLIDLDNDRYGEARWTTVRDVLRADARQKARSGHSKNAA